MTREARMMSGIILITVPTIQYGGYFLLTSLMNKGSGYMENPLRQNFFRAGHAHGGVSDLLGTRIGDRVSEHTQTKRHGISPTRSALMFAASLTRRR